MKSISRDNYEVWMIDYFDGKLTAGEADTLMAFLDSHEDLKEEFELISLELPGSETVQYPGKEKLKRKIPRAFGMVNETNYENYFTAYYEQDLNTGEKEALEGFLKLNPLLKDEFHLHAKLSLVPEHDIKYAGKAGLRRKPAVGRQVYWITTAAAALLLLFLGIRTLLDNERNVPADLRTPVTTYTIPARDITFSVSAKAEMIAVLAQRETNSREIVVADLRDQRPLSREEILRMKPRGYDVAIAALRPESGANPVLRDEPGIIYADASFSAEEPERKKLLGRIITGLLGQKEQGSEQEVKTKDPAFVRLLGQSLLVFNTITGSDSQLEKTYNEKGQLTNYRFEGETLGWSKNYTPVKE